MLKKHIVVIGAGISGLCAAYHLSRNFPLAHITVLEKEKRAGGWMRSEQRDGFFFEMGPRVFKGSKSKALLQLICELGLKNKVLVSSRSSRRYIAQGAHLRPLPKGPLSFIFSSYFLPLCFSCVRELFIKPSKNSDESVADFIERRFGRYVHDNLFDPLVQGIYATDTKDLSILSCFEKLKMLEMQHGSVIRGGLKELIRKSSQQVKTPLSSKLFTVDGGVEKIIDALKEKGRFELCDRHAVLSLKKEADGYHIETDRRRLKADAVFIAVDASSAAKILQDGASYAAHLLSSIPSVSITSVCIGFKDKVLKKKGFGYLVPSKENSPILGCVMDSEVFHDTKGQTRLTLMLKGVEYSEKKIKELTSFALQDHLGLVQPPDYTHVVSSERCIPKMLVGHSDIIARLQKEMQKSMPDCFLIGNYVSGVSVNDCIATAYAAAERLKNEGSFS